MGVGDFPLSFLRPRSPHRGFLLGDPDQHYSVFTFSGRRFQVGASYLLLVLSLLELHHGNLVPLGKLVDGLDVGLPDLPKGCRRGNLELPLPAEEDAHLSYRLKLGDVSLQEDSVNGTALERHVVPP